MSLVSAVRTYLATYSGLNATAAFLVDVLGSTPTQYAVVPLPGPSIVENYLNGASVRQFAFALQSQESTADDVARAAVYEFYEGFAAWIEAQNKAGTFPTLATGKTPEAIEVLGQPILFEYGDSGTGIYQIQCRLTYHQIAP